MVHLGPSGHLPIEHGGYFALLSLDIREREGNQPEIRILSCSCLRRSLKAPGPHFRTHARGVARTNGDSSLAFWFRRGGSWISTIRRPLLDSKSGNRRRTAPLALFRCLSPAKVSRSCVAGCSPFTQRAGGNFGGQRKMLFFCFSVHGCARFKFAIEVTTHHLGLEA